MSNGTHFYKFQTKEDLVDYLKGDLKRIAYGILKQNLVCEEQYDKLNSYLIEEHGGILREVLSELTGEDIIYDYSPAAGMYFLYAYRKMTREKAFVEVSQWNDFYYK